MKDIIFTFTFLFYIILSVIKYNQSEHALRVFTRKLRSIDYKFEFSDFYERLIIHNLHCQICDEIDNDILWRMRRLANE